jgi:RNA polymerase sigma-70 factor (ECF subfamily)
MGTPSTKGGCGQFATTRWSVVVAAGRERDGDNATSVRRALETLCRAYWYPLYAYVRRKGHPPDDAADLVQGFFASFLERHAVAAADPDRGRFRAFLLASLDHFTANQWRRDNALKRGGGRTTHSLDVDFGDGERRYATEPAHDLTPDRIYEQRWALTVIDAATSRLRDEYAARGKAPVFDALIGLIGGDRGEAYAEVAGRLSMTEGAVKVAAHRMRGRLRELLRAAVAETVADESDIDEELRHLFAAV